MSEADDHERRIADHPTTARYLLDALLECGIDHVFANLGTDHVSIIEEVAAAQQQGRPCPRFVLCPHENVAMHMAGGYALTTGVPQAVLVHVDAGTANAAMGAHNLCRMRLGVLLIAGRAPFAMRGELPGGRDTYVHYIQDPFDIGSLVRPYVKWEYTLPHGRVVKEVVHRARSVLASAPAGPAYLALPREILAERHAAGTVTHPAPTDHPVTGARGLAPDAAEAIADRLVGAERPIAVTSHLGRSAEAVAALAALAEEVGLLVVETNAAYLNLPSDHAAHAGFTLDPHLDDADLLLMLDCDVPYLPDARDRAARIPCIHIDTDAGKRGLPMWGFPAVIRHEADCAVALAQIREAVHRKLTPARAASARQRLAGRPVPPAAQPAPAQGQPLTAGRVTAAVVARLTDDDVILNEAIRNAAVVQAGARRTKPGTYVGLVGGGLGFSGGFALGMKLAQPGRRVVQFVGDGTFHFCNPDSVYAVAAQEHLPIFTIVLDNGGWAAVKAAVERVHPDGAAAATRQFLSRLDGRGERRFEQVGEAFGAFGIAVDGDDELASAFDQCLAQVDSGRSAILVARIGPL